mgnify:CR=1 FL=1
MRLLLLADTHWPRRCRDLPQRVWDEVDAADLVVHAGDWVEEGLLDRLQDTPPQDAAGDVEVPAWRHALINDGPELRARLPETARATIEGVRLAVTHETGAATGRGTRADRVHPATDLLVFGHSHIPWDTTTPGGMRLLNPGSPTDRRRQPTGTFLVVELARGTVTATLHTV